MKSKKLNKTSLTVIAVIVAIFTIINASFTFAYFTANKSISTPGGGLNFGKLELDDGQTNIASCHTEVVPGCTLTFSGNIKLSSTSTIDALVRVNPTVTIDASTISESAVKTKGQMEAQLLSEITSKLSNASTDNGKVWVKPTGSNYYYLAGKMIPNSGTEDVANGLIKSYNLGALTSTLALEDYDNDYQGIEISISLSFQAIQADHLGIDEVDLVYVAGTNTYEQIVSNLYTASASDWTAAFSHTITFNANGGDGTMETTALEAGSNLPANTFTAPSGKTFAGWATSSDGEVVYNDEDVFNGVTNTTLYAIWELLPPTDISQFSFENVNTNEKTVSIRKASSGFNATNLIIPKYVYVTGTADDYSFSYTGSEVNKCEVVDIVNNAFSSCITLTSVIIPDSVTSINNYAFSSCSNLTSIEIPNSVEIIDAYAFSNCNGLKTGSSDNNIYYLGNSSNKYLVAFSIDDKTVNEIEINPNTEFIYTSAFSGCTGLTSIAIPNGVTSIGTSAFSSCTGLTSITIPSSVTSIGASAFSGCTNLKSINSQIDSGELNIPNGVRVIGERAFQNCRSTNLTNVTIPSSVCLIKQYAFDNCQNLTDIAIGDNSIVNNSLIVEERAFNSCSKLSQIFIGANVVAIDFTSFPLVLNSITSLDISENNTVYTDGNCNSIIEKGLNILFKSYGNSIPNNITIIGQEAFRSSKISSLTIPASVTTISDYAFKDCAELTSLEIPSTVTNIGESVFDGCSKIVNAQISANITSIGMGMFYGCTKLESVTIPSSITSIGDSAFSGCYKLKYFNTETDNKCVLPDNVKYIGSGAFSGCSRIYDIVIPSGIEYIGSDALPNGIDQTTSFNGIEYLGNSTNPYLVAFGCQDYNLTTCNIHSNTRIIYSNLLYNAYEVKTLNLGENIISIGYNPFEGCCSILENISIPDTISDIDDNAIYYQSFENLNCTTYNNVQYLGNSSNPYAVAVSVVDKEASAISLHANTKVINQLALSNCVNITSITIPQDVKSIGGSAFYGCNKLESVTFNGTNLTRIGPNAFCNCSKLESVNIPNGVITIDSAAFQNCSSLVSVTIPNTVTTIYENAFKNCTNLDKVNSSIAGELKLPNNLLKIYESAFSGCSKITDVTMPARVESLGNQLFLNCRIKNLTIDSIDIARANSVFNNISFYNEKTIYVKNTIPYENLCLYIKKNFTRGTEENGYVIYTMNS